MAAIKGNVICGIYRGHRKARDRGHVTVQEERKPKFETLSGIEAERVYTPDNVGNDYNSQIGFPGEYPFTRGIQPTMYRGRFWTMRQYAGYASASESNARYKYLLAHGNTGLSVAFDLPTQTGYDSDAAIAEGEVGKVGVAISSLDDMERLFDGIPLNKVSTSMTINSTAAILLALYVAVARKQGVDPKQLRGTVQNDILKEYIARGTYIFPPAPSMRLATDVIEYCARELPNWNPISISGYHIREAGSTAVQEVAFTFANAIEYVNSTLARGLSFDEFAPQLSFFFVAQLDFLEEIAKFRAARRLWARIAKERFGAKNAAAMMLRFHTQTAGVSLTAQQPQNNIVRTAIEALAAVLGGTQSLHTNSFDEALALPSEESVRVALRTQQIIAHESGVANTVDPVAGSYYIENLTDEIERRAVEYIERIERMGGALKAIEAGFITREIQESSWKFQREVEAKERIVVGVNEYITNTTNTAKILRVDRRVRDEQIARLQALRGRRDAARVKNTLNALCEAAQGTANLMPAIIDCVENYVTLGEICDVLRQEFGEYRGAISF
ncbi:MAG: methylmalonyl-CoA mutase family protein [Chloroflexi bacterium]|nr:methylmalonyl-CoA mutase family protein [Chloroflexota bacterium]